MNTYRNLVIALGLIIALIIPTSAFADKQIPFCACYSDEVGNCNSNEPISESGQPDLIIGCEGPWLRESSGVFIKPGQTICPFYTVDVTAFSPYGHWTCTTFLTGVEKDPVARVSFTLNKDVQSLELIITSDTIVLDPTINNSAIFAATANLGDDNRHPRNDRDTFSFMGTAGDNVVVTLEENPESGHVGEQATLILRNKTNGNSLREIKTGALPIDINATLPTSGEYELIVEYRNIPDDLKYRGNYFLSLESASGEVLEIKPSFNVEQF